MFGVITIGASSDSYSFATFSAASRLYAPTTTRSGCMKSWIAEPSRRNSGFDTTSAVCFEFRFRMTSDTMSPVSGGTVDLLTTSSGPSMWSAMEFAADST